MPNTRNPLQILYSQLGNITAKFNIRRDDDNICEESLRPLCESLGKLIPEICWFDAEVRQITTHVQILEFELERRLGRVDQLALNQEQQLWGDQLLVLRLNIDKPHLDKERNDTLSEEERDFNQNYREHSRILFKYMIAIKLTLQDESAKHAENVAPKLIAIINQNAEPIIQNYLPGVDVAVIAREIQTTRNLI